MLCDNGNRGFSDSLDRHVVARISKPTHLIAPDISIDRNCSQLCGIVGRCSAAGGRIASGPGLHSL